MNRAPRADAPIAPETASCDAHTLGEAAFHGLAGDVVRTIEPHSEADPAALLVQFLVTFGYLVGRNRYYAVEGDKHYPNLYVVIVGKTSKARKGTSWGRIETFFSGVKKHWIPDRVVSGLTTGEGLICSAKGESDPPSPLLVVEGEFSRTLRAMGRTNSTLSQVMRSLWDRGDANILTKHEPVVVHGAHVGIIGHITEAELATHLSDVEMLNGFANRFLWCEAQRSKELPFGGNLSDKGLDVLRRRTGQALTFAMRGSKNHSRHLREVSWGSAARPQWDVAYRQLAVECDDAMLDATTGRSEAQVCRLAMLYALLDEAEEMRIEHLDAALAVHDYCHDSARELFGKSSGDATADKILTLIRRSPGGITRSDISKHFSRHRTQTEIDRALSVLDAKGLMRAEKVKTLGRTAERWFAST